MRVELEWPEPCEKSCIKPERKGKWNGIKEGMAAKIQKGILRAFRFEFWIPKSRFAGLNMQTVLLQTTWGHRIERSNGRDKKENHLTVDWLVDGIHLDACCRKDGEGVVAVVDSESTAFFSLLKCHWILVRDFLISHVLLAYFPFDEKPVGYHTVAVWTTSKGYLKYKQLGHDGWTCYKLASAHSLTCT